MSNTGFDQYKMSFVPSFVISVTNEHQFLLFTPFFLVGVDIGAIVGGLVGAIIGPALLALGVILIVILVRHKISKATAKDVSFHFKMNVTPYSYLMFVFLFLQKEEQHL